MNVRYFILEDGMKVCDHCFKYNHCATCYKCNKPIISGTLNELTLNNYVLTLHYSGYIITQVGVCARNRPGPDSPRPKFPLIRPSRTKKVSDQTASMRSKCVRQFFFALRKALDSLSALVRSNPLL